MSLSRRFTFELTTIILLGIGLIYYLVGQYYNNNVSIKRTELSFEDFLNKPSGFLNQSDSRILNYIKEHHLIKPSASSGAYNLTTLDTYASSLWTDPVSAYVIKLLKNQVGGFFIECGANDGEFLSNTLRLELRYGWTGLLVEADSVPLKILKDRNRRAWIADVCLATEPYPHKVEMFRHKSWSGMSYMKEIRKGKNASDFNLFQAKCFPLFSILMAMEINVVDYFSMDIEGAELDVLKTFIFDGPILIKVISAEALPGKAAGLTEFLLIKGYQMVKHIQGPYVADLIFVHNSIKNQVNI